MSIAGFPWFRLPRDLGQRGASAVEYAILVGFIAAVIVTAIGVFGLRVNDLFALDLTP